MYRIFTYKMYLTRPSCKQYSPHSALTLKPFTFEGLQEGL